MSILLYTVLVVVGVTLLAITAVRVLMGGIGDPPRPGASARSSSKDRSAQRILEERFAAGELSTDEFQRRLRVLQRGDR